MADVFFSSAYGACVACAQAMLFGHVIGPKCPIAVVKSMQFSVYGRSSLLGDRNVLLTFPSERIRARFVFAMP